MIGDCVLPFKKVIMTKKPKHELYPIAKVEEYEFGKVKNTFYEVRKPDGTTLLCKDYIAAEKEQQKLLDKKEKV